MKLNETIDKIRSDDVIKYLSMADEKLLSVSEFIRKDRSKEYRRFGDKNHKIIMSLRGLIHDIRDYELSRDTPNKNDPYSGKKSIPGLQWPKRTEAEKKKMRQMRKKTK